MSFPVSRPTHPDHEQPWAMQLVIRRQKTSPVGHWQAVAAAGTAVVMLLDDARSQPEGPWAQQVGHWRAGWIRKVVRRAENKRWEDVQQLPGVTAVVGAAAVRAFVPGPVAGLPAALKKLQVGGTQLPVDIAETVPADGVDAPVVTVYVTPEVEMSTGKAAAQVGHAAQLTYEWLVAASAGNVLEQWRATGFAVHVEQASPAKWETIDSPVRVVDAGFTEVAQHTETARAVW